LIDAETKLRQVHEESLRAGDRVSAARALRPPEVASSSTSLTRSPTLTGKAARETLHVPVGAEDGI